MRGALKTVADDFSGCPLTFILYVVSEHLRDTIYFPPPIDRVSHVALKLELLRPARDPSSADSGHSVPPRDESVPPKSSSDTVRPHSAEASVSADNGLLSQVARAAAFLTAFFEWVVSLPQLVTALRQSLTSPLVRAVFDGVLWWLVAGHTSKQKHLVALQSVTLVAILGAKLWAADGLADYAKTLGLVLAVVSRALALWQGPAGFLFIVRLGLAVHFVERLYRAYSTFTAEYDSHGVTAAILGVGAQGLSDVASSGITFAVARDPFLVVRLLRAALGLAMLLSMLVLSVIPMTWSALLRAFRGSVHHDRVFSRFRKFTASLTPQAVCDPLTPTARTNLSLAMNAAHNFFGCFTALAPCRFVEPLSDATPVADVILVPLSRAGAIKKEGGFHDCEGRWWDGVIENGEFFHGQYGGDGYWYDGTHDSVEPYFVIDEQQEERDCMPVNDIADAGPGMEAARCRTDTTDDELKLSAAANLACADETPTTVASDGPAPAPHMLSASLVGDAASEPLLQDVVHVPLDDADAINDAGGFFDDANRWWEGVVEDGDFYNGHYKDGFWYVKDGQDGIRFVPVSGAAGTQADVPCTSVASRSGAADVADGIHPTTVDALSTAAADDASGPAAAHPPERHDMVGAGPVASNALSAPLGAAVSASPFGAAAGEPFLRDVVHVPLDDAGAINDAGGFFDDENRWWEGVVEGGEFYNGHYEDGFWYVEVGQDGIRFVPVSGSADAQADDLCAPAAGHSDAVDTADRDLPVGALSITAADSASAPVAGRPQELRNMVDVGATPGAISCAVETSEPLRRDLLDRDIGVPDADCRRCYASAVLRCFTRVEDVSSFSERHATLTDLSSRSEATLCSAIDAIACGVASGLFRDDDGRPQSARCPVSFLEHLIWSFSEFVEDNYRFYPAAADVSTCCGTRKSRDDDEEFRRPWLRLDQDQPLLADFDVRGFSDCTCDNPRARHKVRPTQAVFIVVRDFESTQLDSVPPPASARFGDRTYTLVAAVVQPNQGAH